MGLTRFFFELQPKSQSRRSKMLIDIPGYTDAIPPAKSRNIVRTPVDFSFETSNGSSTALEASSRDTKYRNLKIMGATSQSTVETAKTTPKAANVLKPLMSVEILKFALDCIIIFDVHTRIGENRRRCVASNVKNKSRCGHKTIQISSSGVSENIEAISKYIARFDYVSVATHIRKLLAQVVCTQHRNLAESSTNIKWNRWNRPSMHVLLDLTYALQRVSADNLQTLHEWLRVITKCDLPLLAPASSTSKASTVSFTTNHTKPKVSTATPNFSSKFKSFQAEPSSDLKIAKALRSKIEKPLKKSDKEDGFMYIFWDKKIFGMVKVGRTNDLERRLKEWNRQCKTTHYYHQSSRDGKLLKVPHVRRIEALMHIELVNYRKKRACEGCSKTHIEWFEISEAKVLQVFQKWRDWIVQEPYAVDGEGKWTVRSDMLDSLPEVCEPVVFLDTRLEKPQPCRGDKKRQTMPRSLGKWRKYAVNS
ncbi:uncharacterized protein EKO05_0011265 [Ascochyta rabiei]|uniref:uncharacterized protein n=1 Tax=Didymella rabiei TaxID=5454 RepID=UPI0022025B41|nr:uncharacterized protein EKO05_0011265 [Ascochyta rabiei]UPX21059.1 hypothetical protein EKO05_0011265 [Ascochyta rabiei]